MSLSDERCRIVHSCSIFAHLSRFVSASAAGSYAVKGLIVQTGLVRCLSSAGDTFFLRQSYLHAKTAQQHLDVIILRCSILQLQQQAQRMPSFPVLVLR